MAKKKKSEKHIHRHEAGTVKQTSKDFSLSKVKLPKLETVLLVLIIIVAYLPVFKAGFVWDDTDYIERNQLIRSINLKNIFSKYAMGNYHPFTMLAFAIEYQLFGLNETGFHVVNLLVHLINIFLVYYSIILLTDKNKVAFVTALLFGIHPLHTESVAWISGLKDLLYTSFFLGAYIFYLKYLDQKQRKLYLLALLFFLFSLLSKAMAVSLPAIFLLTDYYKNRKLDFKAWIEKIPFFLLAIVFGVVAILAQKSSEAIQDLSVYPFPQRIIFACFGFVSYLWKTFLPIHQSVFYPYPIQSGEKLTIFYYVYPLLLVVILAMVIYSRRFTNKIIFGFAFFTITIFLVLQLLPVGEAVMADRYTYIPLIGFFYLAGEGFQWLWNKHGKNTAIAILATVSIFFSIVTYTRNNVWHDGVTLWTDVINKFPHALIAYNNRGGTYMNQKRFEEAIPDLNKVIELQPDYAEALSNRGIILYSKKRYNEALNDLNRAIQSRPNYAYALNNRGTILMELNKYSESLKDFNAAIELNPDYAEAYYNRGLLYMNENRYDKALQDYNKALDLKPGYPEAIINRGIILNDSTGSEKALTDYNNGIRKNPGDAQLYYSRGLILKKLNRNAEAISDFNTAIKLKPDYFMAYLERGNAFTNARDSVSALKDYSASIELNPRLAEAYLARANIFRNQNKHEDAIKDYNKALELNPKLTSAYQNRGILFIKEKKFENVITDFSKVLELKGDSAMSYYNRGMAEIFLNRTDVACSDLQLAANFGFQAAINAHKQFCQ